MRIKAENPDQAQHLHDDHLVVLGGSTLSGGQELVRLDVRVKEVEKIEASSQSITARPYRAVLRLSGGQTIEVQVCSKVYRALRGHFEEKIRDEYEEDIRRDERRKIKRTLRREVSGLFDNIIEEV